MKLHQAIAAMALAIVAATGAAAQESAGRIAVVDRQEAILNTKFAQDRFKIWRESDSIKELDAQMRTLSADLQAMRKDAEANAEKWQDDRKAEFQKNFQYRQADLELTGKKLDAERKQLLQEINDVQAQKMVEALRDLVKAEGIGLLLDKQVALHADNAYDITAKLTARLDG